MFFKIIIKKQIIMTIHNNLYFGEQRNNIFSITFRILLNCSKGNNTTCIRSCQLIQWYMGEEEEEEEEEARSTI